MPECQSDIRTCRIKNGRVYARITGRVCPGIVGRVWIGIVAGFTSEYSVFAIKQSETGVKVDEVCRKMGISEATFYAWKKKYGGLGVSELRELRQLKEENTRLKQMVADLSLDKQMLQDVIKKKL